MRKLIQTKKDEKNEEKNYNSVFPPIKTKVYSSNTDFQKVLELLINYSKIIQYVNYLTKESKWYSAYLKLEKIRYTKDLDESLGTIIDNLLNGIWKNIDKPEKKTEIINEFKYQLRSSLLLSLYNINNSYLNLNKIRIELNRYIKGDYSTEHDKFWASGLVDYLPPDFIILIPEINPKDLIPLFALEKVIKAEKDDEIGNKKEIQKGLFFSTGLPSTKAKTFFNEIIKLNEGEFSSYEEILDKIFDLFNDIILKKIVEIKEEKEEEIKDEEKIEPIRDNFKYNLIKKIIKENPEHIHYNVLEFLENLYKYIPDNKESKIDLEYDDLFFIKEKNWLKNFDKKYNQYPNIIYFLLDNRENFTEITLREKLYSIEKNNYNFPIFIHFLRIFGDISYMKQDDNKNNFIGSKIIQTTLVNNILNKLEMNSCSNLNWLKLLNDKINLPKESKKLYNPRIEYFYNYLQFLGLIKLNDEESIKIFEEVIEQLINNIIEIVFYDKIEELFTTNIFNEEDKINENFKFFCDITSLVKEIADSKSKEDEKKFLSYFEEKMQNLQKLFNKYYSSNKNNLYKNIIDVINKEIEKNYILEKEKDLEERKNKKENKLNKFITNINIYKEDFEKVKKLKLEDRKNFGEINKVVNNLKEINFELDEKRKIFSDNKEEEIEISSYKIEKPEDVEKLELEGKIINLIEYKQYFYVFSENHLHVSVKVKGKIREQKLDIRKEVIKYLDFEQIDKIKESYQNDMKKLVIDDTLVKPIFELNDNNIAPDLENDKLFINMKKFFENCKKLITNLTDHIGDKNILKDYKKEAEKLLNDIKNINMLRPFKRLCFRRN